jgi:guanylate kinase
MLVISSPSGAGKTSLSRRLIAEHPQLLLSVSYTTREPRSGEADGREYHFVSPERFEAMIGEQAFIEHAHVHEHRYGTPREPVTRALDEGRDVLFDIDWQGARNVAAEAPADVVRVFILPPSMAELRRRLVTRAQDAADVIERRLTRARDEIRMWVEYDFVIVNDDFDRAYEALRRIYLTERRRRVRNPWLSAFVQGLLSEPT